MEDSPMPAETEGK